MVNEVNKSKIVSSFFWKFLERGGTQGIQFVVQIVPARLLFPQDYGLIALVAVFISFANIFVVSGFNTALIQKKEADEVDFSSVFYLSLSLAALIYFVLFVTAPVIAGFFREPQLIIVLRVLSLTLFFGAINSVQNTYLAKNMMFKKQFFSSVGGILVSGIVGVAMALIGCGVWALVIQQLVNQFIITIILWFTVKWRPRLIFSLKRTKILFAFGWKLLVSSLLDATDKNIRTLSIGRYYSSDMLGYYNRGQHIPTLISNNLNTSIQSVMFPAFASHQDDRKRIKHMMKRAIRVSSFIMFPMMVGLAVISEQLVEILLTNKWMSVVPFLQISCAAEALTHIHVINLQAINALGRSDTFLRLEIAKTAIGITVLFISMPYGIYAIAWGVFFSSLIATFINTYPNGALLDYSILEQCKDFIPSLLISLLMGAIVYFWPF